MSVLTHPETLWRWLRQWRTTHLNTDRSDVVAHVDEAGALGPRYAFMIVMSCGIATLGLLQNSVAVIIGAMLISPLMGPIVKMGMSLATFDLRSLREALKTLVVGVLLSLGIAALIVLVSPLQEPTPEILARTAPNLFDLLVAIFSGLAGAYATVTRKGETIVGVAIATALMPPLAVTGFGLAVGNGSIAGGAGFLFMTNLLAIALSVTIMARWYGFGRHDSPKQTAWQAALIVTTFVLLSIPLGIALRNIAARGLAERTVRTTLNDAAREANARVTTLRVERADETILVDAVLLTPSAQPRMAKRLEDQLEDVLERPVRVTLSEVLTADEAALARDKATLAELRASVQRLQTAQRDSSAAQHAEVEKTQALAQRAMASLGQFDVVDQGRQARWLLSPQAGLDVPAARRLEQAMVVDDATRVQVVPAFQPLPMLHFEDDSSVLDADAEARLADILWALQRWQYDRVDVLGHAGGEIVLAQARADAVAEWLRARDVEVAAATAADRDASRQLIAEQGRDAIRVVQVSPAAR
ncbi:DUF389 domain-containing protein [Lysobacter sp. SG-8]|uniref:DUF389 domain-containing protein n=1 Tax=Marilutibacter penaei TaxID=2759900 RepID=A0A7W3YEQ7_9GAMM|nr:DUF389 domain-containing protein [Lysobacter penaei]MBB1088683.1 DUF389 domain-containing protein [Lysobacter penaei]